ncbi:Mpo1-like protein [Aliiglaciecola aliphaticivorans]
MAEKEYKRFSQFYPFYLREHQNPICRRLHFVGSFLILLTLAYIIFTGQWRYFIILPFLGYGFAWVGHFFFEHNRPATFTYPFYSFLGDWVMFKDMLTGKIKF